VRPKGLFGETQNLMPVSELVMNAKSKERDCIYFDGITGQGFATVNRGQWYNMMLFMHLMQRNVKKLNTGVNSAEELEKRKLAESEEKVF